MVIHWINLAKRKSAIEKIELALHEIKKIIPLQSKISFLTNLKESSPMTELYFQTEFVMCPVVISQKLDFDTVLLIEMKDKAPMEIEKMDTILIADKYDFHIRLLRKR